MFCPKKYLYEIIIAVISALVAYNLVFKQPERAKVFFWQKSTFYAFIIGTKYTLVAKNSDF